jgi:hypothetical protein
MSNLPAGAPTLVRNADPDSFLAAAAMADRNGLRIDLGFERDPATVTDTIDFHVRSVRKD